MPPCFSASETTSRPPPRPSQRRPPSASGQRAWRRSGPRTSRALTATATYRASVKPRESTNLSDGALIGIVGACAEDRLTQVTRLDRIKRGEEQPLEVVLEFDLHLAARASSGTSSARRSLSSATNETAESGSGNSTSSPSVTPL